LGLAEVEAALLDNLKYLGLVLAFGEGPKQLEEGVVELVLL